MPKPELNSNVRFGVDLTNTEYVVFNSITEEEILKKVNAKIKTIIGENRNFQKREVKADHLQKIFLEEKRQTKEGLTDEEQALFTKNKVDTNFYSSWKKAVEEVKTDIDMMLNKAENQKRLETDGHWDFMKADLDDLKNPEKHQIKVEDIKEKKEEDEKEVKAEEKQENKKQKTKFLGGKNFLHKLDFFHLFHKKKTEAIELNAEEKGEAKEVDEEQSLKNENKNDKNIKNQNQKNEPENLNNAPKNQNQENKEKDKDKEIKNDVAQKEVVNKNINGDGSDEMGRNVNQAAEQIKKSEKNVLEEENNQKANVEDNKKEAEKNDTKVKEKTDPPVNQEKLNASLLAFGDQLNNTAAENQAVQSSMLLKNSTEASEADKKKLMESHKALEEKEADVRKYMPVKTDELNISVPDLIQDQMRLEAGQMSRDEKNQHFMNIIKMKGMDGDKYDKQLRDYGMKVAEEAGREFEKKHQDPAKLSFLNKSANAIETVMCAMSRNPLGILMLLAAAMYAPLMMVGLLAFTAWKRKRPNPAYQNAWQEQNRRELEQKREQLANLYNVDASSISDREVTKALKADYVNAKIIDAMDAKLERDSRKAVDSIAKDYAKSISKESGTKYSAKDLKDSAKKNLMRAELEWKGRGDNAATLLTNREQRMWEDIKQHENKRGMGGRSM